MKFAEYLTEKGLTEDALKEKSADQLANLYNEFNESKFEELQQTIEANKGNDNTEAVTALKSEIEAIKDNQLKHLNEALISQGVIIKQLSKQEKEAKTVGLFDTVKKGLIDNKEKLSALKNGTKESFSIKVAGTMTITGNVSGGNVPVEDRESGLNRVARRMPFISSLIAGGTTASQVVSWVEQQNIDGGAGGTAEGAAKNQADFDLVVVSESIKKRTVFIKVSDEMLDDVDFMASEINNELMELLLLDVDDQVLNGNGAGNNLNGIVTQATAFAAGTFATSIDEANNWDVLKVGMNQIVIANHQPNWIVMHPSDVTEMGLTKASDGQYILPPFQSAEGMSVSGVRIVENTGITAGDFLIMDGTKSSVFTRESMSIEVGFDSDDFTKNLRTVRAEWRGLNRIKGNDDTAFVTGTFSTAKAALETP
jgi:HK97 family phage major capsid protein